MEFKFTVHRANETKVNQTVLLNNEPITASVDGFEVEFVDEKGNSYVRRFVGSEVETAKKAFSANQKVSLMVG